MKQVTYVCDICGQKALTTLSISVSSGVEEDGERQLKIELSSNPDRYSGHVCGMGHLMRIVGNEIDIFISKK